MFDEHFERSVGEILYGDSLLQLGEECKKFVVLPPRSLSTNLFAELLAPITIELPCCQKWPVFLEAAISKGKPFLMSCRINPFDAKFTWECSPEVPGCNQVAQSRHQIALVVWDFHPLNLATMDQVPAQTPCPSLDPSKREMF